MRNEATTMLKTNNVGLERTHHEPKTKPKSGFEAKSAVTLSITMNTQDYGRNSTFQALDALAHEATDFSNLGYTIEATAVISAGR